MSEISGIKSEIRIKHHEWKDGIASRIFMLHALVFFFFCAHAEIYEILDKQYEGIFNTARVRDFKNRDD